MKRKVKEIVDINDSYLQLLKACGQKIGSVSSKAFSHGLSHGVNTAYNLIELDEKYDLNISNNGYDIIAAAILHDINRPYEVHENNGIVPNGELSAEEAYLLLSSIYGEEKAKNVAEVIKYHDDPSLASHDGGLMEATTILRAADVLDADITRVLACAYEYSQLKGTMLSPREIARRWKRKVDYDLDALRDLDERIMKEVEEHYRHTTNQLEQIIALEGLEDLRNGEGLSPLEIALKDSALVERAKEEACREVVSRL